MSVNKAIILGNICKDPEIRMTQDGREIATFSLATNESWKTKDGEKKEKAEFHNIVVFSQGLVGIVKNYVQKGSKLYIEGQIQTRKWQDKEGKDRYSTEIVLQGFGSKIELLSGKSDKPDQHQEAKQNGYQPQVEDNSLDSDIPF
jgi:single-strand DNA-binding protein